MVSQQMTEFKIFNTQRTEMAVYKFRGLKWKVVKSREWVLYFALILFIFGIGLAQEILIEKLKEYGM